MENTTPSFLAAVDAGATWVELDVQATRDGILAVQHNLVELGHMVHEFTSAEWVAAGGLTLAQVHDALPAWVGVDIEIKAGFPSLDGEDATTNLIVDFYSKHGLERPTFVSSFDPTVVDTLTEQGVATGLLSDEDGSFHTSVGAAIRLGADVACVHARSVLRPDSHDPGTEVVVAMAATFGVQIMVWGVIPSEVFVLAALGVEAVCVDDVAGAVTCLGCLSHT